MSVFSHVVRVQSALACGSNHFSKISFEREAVAGKCVSHSLGSVLGCAVQGARLWGSAQPNKWAQAWLARAICNAGGLPENSIWGKKKNQTTQIFLLKKCNFIIQAPGLNFAYRLGSKVLSYKSFLLCFPASLYLNPSLDDVLKITCGQEAGVFKGYFFRPQENVIFDVTKKVCHLFSSVRHLKGQWAKPQLVGRGSL